MTGSSLGYSERDKEKMKHSTFIGLLFLLPVIASSQNGGMRILPEAGLSFPIGDYKDVNVFAKQGIQAGLNVDKIWGRFGLGLYGGFGKNDIQYDDLLPDDNPGLSIAKSENIIQYNWQQYLLGIGPVLQLNLSKKFNVDLSSKLGLAKISYPDYGRFVAVGDPLNEVYTLYQTKNEDIKKKFNPLAHSALRLNFKASKKMSISLSANYTHVRDVLHSYSYLDADFNLDMSNEALIQSLRTAPTVTETRKCHFNTIGVTFGIGFTIGGKETNPDEKIVPPILNYPADGATISIQEADSLDLEWIKEKPNVNNANYNLWLYRVAESKQEKDSLILKTKIQKSLRLALPESVKLEFDRTYRWKVQAIDDSRLKACPDGCHSMEAMFKVASVLSAQYYHLLSQNAGNYIEIRNQLKFILPKNIEMGGEIQMQVHNQRNEAVFKADNILPGKSGENYTIDTDGKVVIELQGFAEGYYLLELKNASNKTYYLRFMNTKTNALNKE